MLKTKKGITLIALIVTIIVLLILAGVSIAVLTGENGILNRATTTKQKNEEKQAEEELRLGISALTIDYRKNTTNTDSFRDYVMNNKQTLANAMGVNQNEITMERETYTITYKGQMYIVEADGSLSSYRLIELTGFNIKETTLSIQEGRTKKLTIENRTPNGANEGIVWTSSDPTIASVDTNGVVTGVKQSATPVTITATSASGGASATCQVTVTEAISEIEEGINPERYGKYVRYNVDLDINDVDSVDDDWKIFYEDSENVYLIAADYVPVSNSYLSTAMEKMGANLTQKTEYPYVVNWKTNGDFKTYKNSNTLNDSDGAADIFKYRPEGTTYLEEKGLLRFWKNVMGDTMSEKANAKLTACLMDTKIWEEFSSGLPLGIKGKAYAIGAPTLSMWVESWNSKYPNDKLYYNSVLETGYKLGTTSQPTSSKINLSTKIGYNNVLYYPNTTKSSDKDGVCYWLASPSDSDTSCFGVIYTGSISGRSYFQSGYNGLSGVRPVVCLPSTAKLEWDSENNIYTIE